MSSGGIDSRNEVGAAPNGNPDRFSTTLFCPDEFPLDATLFKTTDINGYGIFSLTAPDAPLSATVLTASPVPVRGALPPALGGIAAFPAARPPKRRAIA